jgi:hypothetical protein
MEASPSSNRTTIGVGTRINVIRFGPPYPFPKSSLKAQQVSQKTLGFDDALKMGHLFRTLIRNPDISFGRFGETRIYWSAYVPPCKPGDSYPPEDGSFYPAAQNGFANAIKRSEIVIFSRETVQGWINRGEEIELTDEEKLRKEIHCKQIMIS